jgi:hypothetical protein
MNEQNNQLIICPWCGHISQIIWVHGHGQCGICNINTEECCRGEVCSAVTQIPNNESKLDEHENNTTD